MPEDSSGQPRKPRGSVDLGPAVTRSSVSTIRPPPDPTKLRDLSFSRQLTPFNVWINEAVTFAPWKVRGSWVPRVGVVIAHAAGKFAGWAGPHGVLSLRLADDQGGE